MSELIVEGRTWVFAENNVNTDLMMPNIAFNKPIEEQIKLVFQSNRPGWADQVKQGDILIGGKNFGTGSSRPGAQLFSRLGIQALVAESINGLFYRNCVNYAFLAMECPGITKIVKEGEVMRIDFDQGTVENVNTGKVLQGQVMPSFLMDIIRSGGVLERLKREGYVL